MPRAIALTLLLVAAACNNADNVILGGIGASDVTPQIVFDDIRTSISGKVTLSDASGTPIPEAEMLAVVMTDQPGVCEKLKQHPDYFRKPVEPYLALIMFVPLDRVGTFLPGRVTDIGTGSEVIGVLGPNQPVLPFVATTQGYITVAPADTPQGTFNLLYFPPSELASSNTVVGFPFSGKYKTNDCPNLAGALLP